ncbi:hypothetical protein ACQCT6_15095 [Cytobacillus gottheilii]|uniref:Uncharacterized protein n=1 Tax=Cytobacillus gottheilii TaxID=859144 RepID=A0ABX8FCX7_9BACI|nr:hypothetical protein [Cytobacillus gottheilii]QVY62226.1 hypothetical protein J1899_03720 [Cytobacillus gottheilii]
MKILSHSYRKRGGIEFVFAEFPNSKALLVPIKKYYFVKSVRWSAEDPPVTRQDLEKMELAVNDLMGTIDSYKQRIHPHSYLKKY